MAPVNSAERLVNVRIYLLLSSQINQPDGSDIRSNVGQRHSRADGSSSALLRALLSWQDLLSLDCHGGKTCHGND
ncbi:hypothetical protein [Sphingopyxis yananensis]|uniref:hypothetical protein n=1 Tax=Sphingopyxis yananensis TaxID=2886687 RepID=UPI001D0FBE7E|nr:hypothetical protein [Sphingopyxis yananensis]MCC2600860.1 hypothetical protein [Sphingopyxis yananensis]